MGREKERQSFEIALEDEDEDAAAAAAACCCDAIACSSAGVGACGGDPGNSANGDSGVDGPIAVTRIVGDTVGVIASDDGA